MGQIIVKCYESVKSKGQSLKNKFKSLVMRTYRLTKSGLGKFGNTFTKSFSNKNRKKNLDKIQSEHYKVYVNNFYSPYYCEISAKPKIERGDSKRIKKQSKIMYEPTENPEDDGAFMDTVTKFQYESNIEEQFQLQTLSQNVSYFNITTQTPVYDRLTNTQYIRDRKNPYYKPRKYFLQNNDEHNIENTTFIVETNDGTFKAMNTRGLIAVNGDLVDAKTNDKVTIKKLLNEMKLSLDRYNEIEKMFKHKHGKDFGNIRRDFIKKGSLDKLTGKSFTMMESNKVMDQLIRESKRYGKKQIGLPKTYVKIKKKFTLGFFQDTKGEVGDDEDMGVMMPAIVNPFEKQDYLFQNEGDQNQFYATNFKQTVYSNHLNTVGNSKWLTFHHKIKGEFKDTSFDFTFFHQGAPEYIEPIFGYEKGLRPEFK